MTMDEKDAQQVGLQPGTKIGKFEVLERLAIGGQAIVYKCRDELLDRIVAVKQMSSALAEDPKFLARFGKEAQIMARLSSRQPVIVNVHDVIQDEKGLFMVMEYVEGQSFEQILQQHGTLDAKAGVQVLWRLAAALNDVHISGFIHRDIKPANVILQSGLRPKIMDFGVAASSSGQTSMVLGTTKYMAPELFEGGQVDGRADMYSLGMMMYELMLGREKFNEIFAEIVRDQHSERLRWMKWHANGSVKAPPLHEVKPEIPASLSHIIAKMMAKDPRDRYGSMEELGLAIKSAFSSKAKGKAAKAGAAGMAAGGAPDKRIELEDSGEIPSIPTEPDRQPLEAAPETAPIPKKAMSLRTKLILVGVIVVTILGTGIALYMRTSSAEARRQEQAAKLYNEGYRLFDRRQYTEALEKFRAANEISDTEGAQKALVMGHMSHAWIALRDGDYRAASERQERARQAVNAIQREAANDSDLYKWSEMAAKTVREFGDEQYHVRRFQDTYLQAESYVMQGQLDAAQSELEKLSPTLLPPEQKTKYEALAQRIELERIAARVAQANQRADRAFQQGQQQLDSGAFSAAAEKLLAAQSAYQDLQQIIESDRSAAQHLPEADFQTAMQQVRSRLDRIDLDLRYARAMARAETARINGDRSSQLAALKEAQALKNPPQVADRIERLEVDVMREDALAMLQAGRTNDAIEALREVLQRDPDDAVAREALESLRTAGQFQAMMDAGDRSAAQGDYAAALNHYLRASEIQATDDLNARIANARFEIQWAKAQALLAENDYAEARKAFDAALEHDSAQAPRVETIKARIDRLERFEQLMAEGKEMLSQGQWTQAREKFETAGEALPQNQEEAEKWSSTAICRNYISRARDAFEAEDLPAARGYLRVAGDSARFEEDRRTIANLLQQLPSQP